VVPEFWQKDKILWETGNTQRFERQHPIGDLIRWVDVSVSKKYEGTQCRQFKGHTIAPDIAEVGYVAILDNGLAIQYRYRNYFLKAL